MPRLPSELSSIPVVVGSTELSGTPVVVQATSLSEHPAASGPSQLEDGWQQPSTRSNADALKSAMGRVQRSKNETDLLELHQAIEKARIAGDVEYNLLNKAANLMSRHGNIVAQAMDKLNQTLPSDSTVPGGEPSDSTVPGGEQARRSSAPSGQWARASGVFSWSERALGWSERSSDRSGVWGWSERAERAWHARSGRARIFSERGSDGPLKTFCNGHRRALYLVYCLLAVSALTGVAFRLIACRRDAGCADAFKGMWIAAGVIVALPFVVVGCFCEYNEGEEPYKASRAYNDDEDVRKRDDDDEDEFEKRAISFGLCLGIPAAMALPFLIIIVVINFTYRPMG